MLIGSITHVLAPNELAMIAGASLIIVATIFKFVKRVQEKVEESFQASKDSLLNKIKFIQQYEERLGHIKNKEKVLSEYEIEEEEFSKKVSLLYRYYYLPLSFVVLSWLSLTAFNLYYIFLPIKDRSSFSLLLQEILCMGESKFYCLIFISLLVTLIFIFPFIIKRRIQKKRQNVGNKINKYIADAVISISVSEKVVEEERLMIRFPPTEKNPFS